MTELTIRQNDTFIGFYLLHANEQNWCYHICAENIGLKVSSAALHCWEIYLAADNYIMI